MRTEGHDLESLFPRMRRYTRALSGDVLFGQVLCQRALALATEACAKETQCSPLLVLYSSVSKLWRELGDLQAEYKADKPLSERKRIARMSPRAREAFLLLAMEGLSAQDAASVLNVSECEVSRLMDQAIGETGLGDSASVLIVEDEFFIAKDIEKVVLELGHKVVGRVRTRAAAHDFLKSVTPDLILADIQLADGSSGIDTVNDALGKFGGVPVIFITAFPGQLLSENRPEPTFLVSKPYKRTELKAAITQCLYFGAQSQINTLRSSTIGPALIRFA